MIDLPGVKERETIKPRREMGVPGFSVVGGRLNTIERNSKLVGEQKYITASDMLANISIISAGLHYFLNLVASPNWVVEPVDDSSEAKQAAEFVESCMYDMDSSWTRTIRRAGMYRFYGFGVQEWVAKRRLDGKTGFARVESRPQFTIQEWDVDENGTIRGMWQTSPFDYTRRYLPRGKVIYLVDDTFSDSPEGFGLLRALAEPTERYTEYQRIEGLGFERDFRGVPVGYAPRAEIAAAVDNGDIDAATGQTMLGGMEQFVQMRNKGISTGLLLDSSTYTSVSETGQNVSGAKKWGIELLTGSANGIEHVGAAITRLRYDMAMIIGTDGLLVGSDGGSRALSEDKSRNLYLNVNSCVNDIAETYEKDFISPLWVLNGLDDRLKPSLKAEDVSFRSVEQVTAALRDMATAGAVLGIDDPVINDVRGLLGVSNAPENEGLI